MSLHAATDHRRPISGRTLRFGVAAVRRRCNAHQIPSAAALGAAIQQGVHEQGPIAVSRHARGYASIIRHRGRKSQREYSTPVVPFAVDDSFLVVLPYGAATDWVQNVLAAGSAELVYGGTTYAVDRPELIATDTVKHLFPAREQRTHRVFGVEQCLRLHRQAMPAGAT